MLGFAAALVASALALAGAAPAFASSTTGTITGTATTTSGTPLSGVCVNTFPSGGGAISSATTSSSGTYTIGNLPPNSYMVTFSSCSAGAYATTTVNNVNITAGVTTTVNGVLPPGATISGTVTDSSGTPLSGICVSAIPTNGGNAGGATTSSSGAYGIYAMDAGAYNLQFTACSGGAELTTTVTGVTLTAGVTTKVNAKLSAAGMIYGQVTDGSGNGLSAACVSVTASSGAPGGGSATTNSTGYYKVTDLPTGTYTVTVSACSAGNYAPTTISNVSVTSGSNTQLNPQLATGGIISGTVTNTSGSALSGACVSAAPSGGGNSSASTTTDSSGNYSITGLDAGTYTVTFAGCDAGNYVSSTVTSAAVTVGASTTENATLTPDGQISGIVTNTSGADLSGACVTATPLSGGTGGFANTNSSGSYWIGPLSPGSYSVTFSACSAGDYISKTQTVTVAAGKTTAVNPSLAPSGTILGTVTDTSGNALAGACVTATPIGGGPGGSTSTSPTGSYSIPGLPVDTYTVTFSGCSAGEYVAQSATKSVTAGANSLANAALTPGGMISGTVSNTSGTALSGACVTASPSGGGSSTPTTTASSGSYGVIVAPGTYSVTFSGCAAGNYIPGTITGVNVSVNATSTENARLAPAGTIAGTVTDTSGNALSGACVNVKRSGGGTSGSATTNSSGSYVISGLSAGTYTVAFSACSAGNYAPTTITGASVTVGATTTENASLTAGGKISGRVTDASSGAVLVGACVSETPSAGGSTVNTTTNSSGNYWFTDLTAGSYSVTASGCAAGSYAAETVNGVNATAGSNTTQNVALTPN